MQLARIILAVALIAPIAAMPGQSPADEAALRSRIAAHERASADNDLRGLVDVYSLDAEMISANGTVTRGREAIEAFYRRSEERRVGKEGRTRGAAATESKDDQTLRNETQRTKRADEEES